MINILVYKIHNYECVAINKACKNCSTNTLKLI